MGRKPLVEEFENGDVGIRIRIPRPLWLIALHQAQQLQAQRMPVSPIQILEHAFAHLGERLATGRAARWISEALGLSWELAWREVKRVTVGSIRSGAPTINVDELHRDPTRPGSFYGVTRTKGGFVAWGAKSTLFDDQHRIGTFETSEEAANARAQYYRERNLPYGQWEIDAIKWRRGPQRYAGSDADMLREMREYNESVGLGHLNRLPGLPANPSTVPPTIGERALKGATMPTAALEAANDARERELAEATRQRQLEAGAEVTELPDELEDEIECRGCGAILDREHAVEHVC